MKFFVAKVDPKKVKFVERAARCCRRCASTTTATSSRCRSGSASRTRSGTQDLIVNILAPSQRYEVANYKNVTIPTNLDVKDERPHAVRRVLRRAVRSHARAEPRRGRHRVRVGRERPAIRARARARRRSDFATLGADVLGGDERRQTRLRADAAARALRQERHAADDLRVPRGAADRRRSRAARRKRHARGAARRRRRRTTSRAATRSATRGPAR